MHECAQGPRNALGVNRTDDFFFHLSYETTPLWPKFLPLSFEYTLFAYNCHLCRTKRDKDAFYATALKHNYLQKFDLIFNYYFFLANAEDQPPASPEAPSAVQLKPVTAVSQITVASAPVRSAPVRSAPVQSSYALERRTKHEHRPVETVAVQVLL